MRRFFASHELTAREVTRHDRLLVADWEFDEH